MQRRCRAATRRILQKEDIGLVGIGAMTRMVARAYRVADSLRDAGFKVVMGGPHVTECPDEALGKDGGKRHADAVALGEADDYWADIVEDAANGKLKSIYQPQFDDMEMTRNQICSLTRISVGNTRSGPI
ncbi:MAG: cobalamin-dependent protein [Pyrinomonadaceae bacterium]